MLRPAGGTKDEGGREGGGSPFRTAEHWALAPREAAPEGGPSAKGDSSRSELGGLISISQSPGRLLCTKGPWPDNPIPGRPSLWLGQESWGRRVRSLTSLSLDAPTTLKPALPVNCIHSAAFSPEHGCVLVHRAQRSIFWSGVSAWLCTLGMTKGRCGGLGEREDESNPGPAFDGGLKERV